MNSKHTAMWMSFKNTEPKNPDMEECILYDSMFILSSEKQFKSVTSESRSDNKATHFISSLPQFTCRAYGRKGTIPVLFCFSFFFLLWFGGHPILLHYSNCCFSDQHWPRRDKVVTKRTSLVAFCNVTWPIGSSSILAMPSGETI